MTKKFATYASIFCVLIVMNSCTKEKVLPKEEFSTPEKTYRLWLETAEKGDIPNNVRCVSETSKPILDSQLRNMDAFIGRLNENVKVFKAYTLLEQRAKEDRAVVVLQGKKGDMMIVPLKMEAEGWKIDLISLFAGMG